MSTSFRPFETYRLDAGVASANIAVPMNLAQLEIVNDTNVVAFVAFGVDNTVAATVPTGVASGGFAIGPLATRRVTPPKGATYIAAITAAGSTTLWVSSGTGE